MKDSQREFGDCKEEVSISKANNERFSTMQAHGSSLKKYIKGE